MSEAIPWGAIRSSLQSFSFQNIKDIAGLAGINVLALAHLVQRSGGGATKGQLLSAIDGQLREAGERQNRIITIICEQMLQREPRIYDELSENLSRLGWEYVEGKLLPKDLLSADEIGELPAAARPDLAKAAARLRDGDLSGALAAACGAIDAVTANLYDRLEMGDPTRASFQERVATTLERLTTQERLKRELLDIGWSETEANRLTQNLKGSLNQAAFVMQSLRSNMGDVHGTKPVLAGVVYDSLKWAALLLRLLGGDAKRGAIDR
jgi:hypothetical protein